MTTNLRARAHAVNHEWIEDRDGDVCLRPMAFNDEGIQQVQYRPDPCEFVTLETAVRQLAELEAK